MGIADGFITTPSSMAGVALGAILAVRLRMVWALAIGAVGSALGNWIFVWLWHAPPSGLVIYTATALDAGKPISISLDSSGIQGDWDNVRLSAVPELSTWIMLLLGFAGVGFAGYRRQAGAPFRLV